MSLETATDRRSQGCTKLRAARDKEHRCNGIEFPHGTRQDHALISRYQGSWLIAYRQQPYSQVRPLRLVSSSEAAKAKLDPNLAVEGEVTDLFYVSPKGRTALEAQRNYEAALTQAGAKILFTCTDGTSGCYAGAKHALRVRIEALSE